jgi:xylulokinase
MYSMGKILYVKENEPEIFKKAKTFFQYSGYILYKLSGERYEDWSLSSRTCLFNIINKKFDNDLLDAAGLSGDLFPTPVKPGSAVAGILLAIAQELGLPKRIILVLCGQDQICAAVGGGIAEAGQAINSMGSVDCITPLFDRPIINDAMMDAGFACIPYVLDNHYATYAFNYSGGAMLKWYRDKFGFEAKNESEKTGMSPYILLEQNAPSNPTDLLVLPHLQGAATPYMDIEATGAVVGLTTDTDIGTLYRGLMEGAAYEAKVILDHLKKADVDIHRLVACGGGSRSGMWIQLRANVFDMPIDVLEVEEAGTLGAVIVAGTACGIYADIADGAKQLVKIKKTYYPDNDLQFYLRQYEKYKRMYTCVKEIQGRK